MDKQNQINTSTSTEVDESWAIALLEKELGETVDGRKTDISQESIDAERVDIPEQLEDIFNHIQEESENTLSAIEKQIQARKKYLAEQIQGINKRSSSRLFANCKLAKRLRKKLST